MPQMLGPVKLRSVGAGFIASKLVCCGTLCLGLSGTRPLCFQEEDPLDLQAKLPCSTRKPLFRYTSFSLHCQETPAMKTRDHLMQTSEACLGSACCCIYVYANTYERKRIYRLVVFVIASYLSQLLQATISYLASLYPATIFTSCSGLIDHKVSKEFQSSLIFHAIDQSTLHIVGGTLSSTVLQGTSLT